MRSLEPQTSRRAPQVTGTGGPADDPERDAAQKAAAHADTPSLAHLDRLGRPFLTFADNGPDPDQPGQHVRFATRVELDIEGNERGVIDTNDRVVMRYDYDLLGTRIHQASMEAGERWILNDVAGKPIRAWDSRGFTRRMTYDERRRPTGLYVTENGVERLAKQTVYGEGQGGVANHRTRVHQVRDGAGVVTSEEYDFKGNLRHSHRRPLVDYKAPVNWDTNPALEANNFASHTAYDAFNRPTELATPDHSVIRPGYNEANLLERLEVNLRSDTADSQPVWTPFVTDIDYDAKGQRTLIDYGNGIRTTSDDDPLTFRLTQLTTTRPTSPDATVSQLFRDATAAQDLRYTFDPAGNIAQIEDAALKTVFHDDQQVERVSSYTYDAFYRLIEARGRDHMGQTAFDFNRLTATAATTPSSGIRRIPATFRRCAPTPSTTHTKRSATSSSCITSPPAAVGRGATNMTRTVSSSPARTATV